MLARGLCPYLFGRPPSRRWYYLVAVSTDCCPGILLPRSFLPCRHLLPLILPNTHTHPFPNQQHLSFQHLKNGQVLPLGETVFEPEVIDDRDGSVEGLACF